MKLEKSNESENVLLNKKNAEIVNGKKKSRLYLRKSYFENFSSYNGNSLLFVLLYNTQLAITCSKLTIETPEQGAKFNFSVSTVNFEQVNADWVISI